MLSTSLEFRMCVLKVAARFLLMDTKAGKDEFSLLLQAASRVLQLTNVHHKAFFLTLLLGVPQKCCEHSTICRSAIPNNEAGTTHIKDG